MFRQLWMLIVLLLTNWCIQYVISFEYNNKMFRQLWMLIVLLLLANWFVYVISFANEKRLFTLC